MARGQEVILTAFKSTLGWDMSGALLSAHMPANKHALIRYQALDRCFQARGTKYFWEDLLEACKCALQEYTGKSTSISRRQLFEDIRFMESEQGWAIPLERHIEGKRVWYRYEDPNFSINKRPLNEDEADQLKEALLTLSRFKGMPQFQWVDELVARLESGFGLKQGAERVIEFEENPYLRGSEHITPLFQAVLDKKVLEVSYQSFRQAEPTTLRFHPSYLKQHNNRWFTFGSVEGQTGVTNLALDRIQAIVPVKGKYKPNKGIDFTEYFEDVVGVSVPANGKPVAVRLLVTDLLLPYVTTKPLHGSQKLGKKQDGRTLLELHVHLNYELETLVLSLGEGVEVIAPKELRKRMTDRVKTIYAQYR